MLGLLGFGIVLLVATFLAWHALKLNPSNILFGLLVLAVGAIFGGWSLWVWAIEFLPFHIGGSLASLLLLAAGSLWVAVKLERWNIEELHTLSSTFVVLLWGYFWPLALAVGSGHYLLSVWPALPLVWPAILGGVVFLVMALLHFLVAVLVSLDHTESSY